MEMIALAIEAIRKVAESFSSRVADQMADSVLNRMFNMKDFEHIFENLTKNLHALSARAADFEEQITNQLRSGQKKRKRQVELWFKEVESIKDDFVRLESEMESEGFVTKLTKGGKAAQLDKQVKKLVEQSRYFDVLVHDVCGTSGEAFLIRALVGQAFGENAEKILRLLESGEVSRIGLYGMGGVGKTTLAQHINNCLKQDPERRVYWVTVSQEFTVTGLQDKIADLLGLKLSGGVEVGQRARRLQTELSQQKSSVLILDDVWDNIDLLQVGCDSSVDGCKLIITTRSVAVCRQIGCQKEIPVEKLGDEEAWKLFHDRLGNEIELVPELEGIAKSMVRLCGGLPLAIITMARSMRGERRRHRWKDAYEELKERVKGHDDGTVKDEVFEVLKFSFDRLKKNNDKSNKFNMKQLCFLYCLLYPEDYQIDRDDLVEKFISGGLLDERSRRRAQDDQGHSILDELVDVCLLESCVNRHGIKCVKMHDLVRSMALRTCGGIYMVIADMEQWTKDVEKVSFMKCGIGWIRKGFSPDCPKLSTLLLSGNDRLRGIPNSFFSKMKGLCTLDLSWNINITRLPNSISEMTSLRSLLFQHCFRLERVPYLGKLEALRELNLSFTAIKEVPAGVDELLNLIFLSINAPDLKFLPDGMLPKLRHLQHLDLPYHIQVKIEEIKALKQLEEFGGRVENVTDFNWFVTPRRVHDPPGYAIHVGSPFRRGRNLRGKNNELLSGKKVNDEKILATRGSTVRLLGEDSRFQKIWNGHDNNLLVLRQSNLSGKKVLGKGVVGLAIQDCEGLSKWFVDDLRERFDNPTSLKKLDIRGCGGIEWITRSDDGQGSQLSTTLEAIELEELDDLKGVVMLRERGEIRASAQPPVFPSLKVLHVYGCKKMRKLGLPVSALSNLEQLTIAWCGEIEEIFEEDEGRDSAAATLPKLKRLSLWNLARLRKVGLAVSGVPSLEEIEIKGCEEIEEIFEEEYEGIAAASTLTLTLPKLKRLRLYDLPRLKRLSKAAIISNSITTIWIVECPELMKKLPLHFGDPTPPPSLKYIVVDSKWWESLEWDANINIHPNLLKFDDILPWVLMQFGSSQRYLQNLMGVDPDMPWVSAELLQKKV